LDYHWHKDRPEWQRERFRVHIRAAKAMKKPLVIHTREAAEDTLAILKEEGASEVGGILHCFTESLAVAEAAIALGFYISISGIVSFKKAEQVHEVARSIPLDRLLVETDSPYLAPVPYRGKPNEPAYVKHVAEAIADLRQISYAEVAEASSRNFLRLFPASASVLAPRVGL
jgi:TatD DNase family protein